MKNTTLVLLYGLFFFGLTRLYLTATYLKGGHGAKNYGAFARITHYFGNNKNFALDSWKNRENMLDSAKIRIKYAFDWQLGWNPIPFPNLPQSFKNCRVDCELFNSKEYTRNMDAVITAQDFSMCEDKDSIEKKRRKKDLIIANMNIEPFSEFTYKKCSRDNENSFLTSPIDISLNYHPNATILTTYYDRTRVPDPDFTKDMPKERLASRKKGACVFVSNCESERMNYIKKLAGIYPIRSFGKCLHNEEFPKISQKDKYQLKQITLKSCKYSLSFESCMTLPHYVSEKIFDSIKSNSLTIYRGAANIEDLLPLNELPVIDANNMTPEQLAAKLKSLDENDSKYNEYFEKKAISPSGISKLLGMRQHAFDNNICSICTAVAEMKYARSLLDNLLFFGRCNNDDFFKISEKQIQKYIKDKKLAPEESKVLLEIYQHAYGSYWGIENQHSNWNDPNYFLKKR